MVFDVIIYCLSIYYLISAIFQGPDTLDKYFHINCKTNEVLFFSLLLISLLTIRFAIEVSLFKDNKIRIIIYYLYGYNELFFFIIQKIKI